MTAFRSLKAAAVLLSVGGLGLGLIGSGVRATITDGGTATVNESVGTFGCALSSDSPGAVISGNSVTVQLPEIDASAPGSDLANVYVSNTGSMPLEVTGWTVAKSGTITYYSSGRMNYSTLAAGAVVAPGATSPAYRAGFQWATALTNTDLGKTGKLIYTATCGEVPSPSSVTGTLAGPGPGYGMPIGGNPISVYGTLTNVGVSPYLHSFTMQIPYTLSTGALTCDMTNAYMASAGGTGSCSIAGGVLTLTQNFASTVTLWTPGHSQSINYVYVGATAGGTLTMGTPVLTAVS